MVVHIGCGMDSRIERIGSNHHNWYDIDFPEVIWERKKYYGETEQYHMIETDVRKIDWINNLPSNKRAIVIMEGISMYLHINELRRLLAALNQHFINVSILMDCYTEFAARASKYRNPINEVGVNMVYGIDYPGDLEQGTKIHYTREFDMTPQEMINELNVYERLFFKTILAGKISRKMYRVYEFEG